jgi:hypothetical protein
MGRSANGTMPFCHQSLMSFKHVCRKDARFTEAPDMDVERRFREMRIMTTAIFIVIYARNKWWIDLNGKSKGPFLNRDSAEIEAISLASNFAKDGRRAEVQVAVPGEKNHIVYQSTDIGMLGRAAALANH